MIIVILLSMAGGLGAVARLALDSLIRARVAVRYPLGTLAINVSGSLLLGMVSGFAARSIIPEAWHLALGTGFMGGYTTFSTASFETVRLFQERRFVASLLNGLGMLILSAGFAALGIWIGLAT